MKEGAAKISSTLLNPAKSPIPTERELVAENQTLRGLLRDLRIPETKDLHALQLQNEVLAAVIDGVLFKERLTEVVKEVLYQELDDYLEKRFTGGAQYRDEAIEEARDALRSLQGQQGHR